MSARLAALLDRLPLIGMALVCGVAAWAVSGWGIAAFVVLGLIFAVLTLPRVPHEALLRRSAPSPSRKRLSPGFGERFSDIARRAGLPDAPRLRWTGGPPNALSVNRRDGVTILISESLHDMLSERQLLAVLAHEVTHIASGDIRLMRLGEALSRVTFALAVVSLITAGAAFMIWGRVLAPNWVYWFLAVAPTLMSGLLLAVSRRREYAADAGAVRLTGDPAALVQALARIQFANRLHLKDTIEEFTGLKRSSWLRTHPAVADRIDRLQQMRPDRA
ncbi:M48 family metalloprotease [Minwuia sp.]|uniref:M48 family metalloprotease n=1 Tax=Minwuia sp. TaxID=2493630 RepID=UPI003A91E61E